MNDASVQHFPERFLGRRQIRQQIHCFSESRPNRGQRFPRRFQGGDAGGPVLVVRVKQRDERSGVDKDQKRPRRSCKSFVKRRPIFSERLGFPPRTTPSKSDARSKVRQWFPGVRPRLLLPVE